MSGLWPPILGPPDGTRTVGHQKGRRGPSAPRLPQLARRARALPLLVLLEETFAAPVSRFPTPPVGANRTGREQPPGAREKRDHEHEPDDLDEPVHDNYRLFNVP